MNSKGVAILIVSFLILVFSMFLLGLLYHKSKKSLDRESLEKLLKQQLGLLEQRFQKLEKIQTRNFITKEAMSEFIKELGIVENISDADLEDIIENFQKEIFDTICNHCKFLLKEAIKAPLENLAEKVIQRLSSTNLASTMSKISKDLDFIYQLYGNLVNGHTSDILSFFVLEHKNTDPNLISQIRDPRDFACRTMHFFNKKLQSININKDISFVLCKEKLVDLICDVFFEVKSEFIDSNKPHETKVQEVNSAAPVLHGDVSQQR